MKALGLFLILLQTPSAPPASVSTTLRQLRDHLEEHRETLGAAEALTTAKHQVRDWVESRLADVNDAADTREFATSLHTTLDAARLLCHDLADECDWNFLGYVDDVRVSRAGEFLVVVTAMGIRCGYDESAYVYARDGQRWRRVWDLEQNTYTKEGYRPQVIHDVQISQAGAGGARVLMALGSQTICGGAFKDIYARAWTMQADHTSARVLDWTAHANDAYPPLQGRAFPDAVLFAFTAGGLLSGEVHTAVRRFTIDQGKAVQVDPVASLPRDFVAEWLSSSWAESRPRSESVSLEAQHADLSRNDGVGDLPDSTLRCTNGRDEWQVATHLYEKPKRYFRVRWQNPYRFTLIDIRDTPYPDCTLTDSRGETYTNLFEGR